MSISIFWAFLCSFEIWALARLLEACVSYILFKVRPQSFLISTSAYAASLAYCCRACRNACYGLPPQLLQFHNFFPPSKALPDENSRPEAITSKITTNCLHNFFLSETGHRRTFNKSSRSQTHQFYPSPSALQINNKTGNPAPSAQSKLLEQTIHTPSTASASSRLAIVVLLPRRSRRN
jgi:hypothetical protein